MEDVDVVDGVPDHLPPRDLDHEVHIPEMKPQRRAMTEADIEHTFKLPWKRRCIISGWALTAAISAFFRESTEIFSLVN